MTKWSIEKVLDVLWKFLYWEAEGFVLRQTIMQSALYLCVSVCSVKSGPKGFVSLFSSVRAMGLKCKHSKLIMYLTAQNCLYLSVFGY